MAKYRSDLPPLPARMRDLPLDWRGYPVPKFVHFIDGVPDFRVIEPGWMAHCHRRHVCWLCGQPLGQFMCFVIGPMCAVNRVSSEPPGHRDCGEYAVRACPFLTHPMARRNERGLPDDRYVLEGAIDRNPGCAITWMTRSYKLQRVSNGTVFIIGEPDSMKVWREGRPATHAEMMLSIESGMPLLREQIAKTEGREGLMRLAGEYDRMIVTMRRLFPHWYAAAAV